MVTFSQYGAIFSRPDEKSGLADQVGHSWAYGVRLEALANVAHELRTPVQALLGYAEMLRETAEEAPGGGTERIIDRITSNLHDLAQTVENVLEFAPAEAGAEAMAEENVDLAELLAEVVEAAEAMNRSKGLEIRVEFADTMGAVRSRRRPIRAILANLALNAVKFTSSGTVAISIREAASGKREGIEIEVRDTGPGIRPELVSVAFERFAQLSASSTRRYRGIGLGLPIVQRNVKALGGTLELESVPGQGSTFKVALPCTIVRSRTRTDVRPLMGSLLRESVFAARPQDGRAPSEREAGAARAPLPAAPLS